MTNFVHKTVLLKEAVDLLDCQPGKTYLDATAGGGGHSLEIAGRIVPDGRLIMLDADPDAIAAASEKLAEYSHITTIIRSNYSEIPEILEQLGLETIDGGILLDLGVSYHQLTSEERGFSFMKDSPLDMRINPDTPESAGDLVNTLSEKDLCRIFSEFGEERFSGRIARNIVRLRKIKKIETTKELADAVKKSAPFSKSRIHPATRVFQALRIAVNRELETLEKTLNNVVPLMGKNARIVIISFHSLEDRLVKHTLKGNPALKMLTKKPVVPSPEEKKVNPSARSAKMRAAEKIQ